MENKLVWELNQLYLNFNTKELKHEVKFKELLPVTEQKLAINLCELVDREQSANSIKLDYQSLEEKIVAKIIQNIQELNLDDEIPLSDFQTLIIDETRNLLYNFRDIKTSFSSGIIKVLKSVIDRKKINANLTKQDVDKVIEKLEDMVIDKKVRRSTNKIILSILQKDIGLLTDKIKGLLTSINDDYLNDEISKSETKLEELVKEKDIKIEKERNKVEELLNLDTNYEKKEDKGTIHIIATIRKEMDQYKNRVTQLRRFISLRKKMDGDKEDDIKETTKGRKLVQNHPGRKDWRSFK